MTAEKVPQRAGWRWLLTGSFFLVVLSVSAVGAWWLRGQLTTTPTPAPTPPQDQALLKRGRLLYQVTCASCHGPDGRGDGPSATELKPPPRDFAEGPWKFGTAPGAVRKVIRDGIPGTPMPSCPSLSESDLDALVAHVLTMAPRASALHDQLRATGFMPVNPPRPAPPLDLLDLDDKPVSLTSFRGTTVLVNFWGTDCIHCLAEMPDLERLAEALRPRADVPGLVVLPVCLDETDRDIVRKVARQHVRQLPVFVDPRGLGKLRYDAQVMPSTYLIDPQGRLIGTAQGRHSWSSDQLKALIASLSP